MSSLLEFLGSGNVYRDKEVIDLKVTKLSDINSKIIPFFVENPIERAKSKDFMDFCKVAELMQNKAHLTAEGLGYAQIRKIKAGMNRGRK